MTNDLLTQLRSYGRQVEQDLAASQAEAPALVRVLVETAPAGPRHRRWNSGPRVRALAAMVIILVITSIWFVARRTTDKPADKPTRIVPSIVSNGWVAFAAWDSELGADLYLVRQGSTPRRIGGSDTDATDEICPAFSPDGTRLLFGQATGSQYQPGGYGDGALVISDLSADGVRAATTIIELAGATSPPCAIWSADGRWVAFGEGTHDRQADPQYIDEVWVVDIETDDIRRLSGLRVSDIEWAPEATELYLASDGILVYSVATDETRRIGEVLDVRSFAVSPDGESIAYQGRGPVDQPTVTTLQSDPSGLGPRDHLWLMNADGTGGRILTAEFDSNHGIGPVWSPDGDHIAYQRLCDHTPPPSSRVCREEHEVVVVTVSDNGALEPAGTEVVIPPPETTGGEGPSLWYPFNVTWSPDGTTLLYLAWSEGASEKPSALVAVPVDATTPPIVLSEALYVSVHSGYPWLPFQSWGRQQGS